MGERGGEGEKDGREGVRKRGREGGSEEGREGRGMGEEGACIL